MSIANPAKINAPNAAMGYWCLWRVLEEINVQNKEKAWKGNRRKLHGDELVPGAANREPQKLFAVLNHDKNRLWQAL